LAAVEEATGEAEKHGDRSEALAALVAEAKAMIEQARSEQAERAKAAAEGAATAAALEKAAAAAAAAVRLRLERQVVALASRMQSDALQLQEAHAQLGTASCLPHTRRTRRRRCACCVWTRPRTT
jgi:hypothetical protein